MYLQSNNIETIINYGCLFVCLAFLILTAIPVIGYFAQIGAVFGMILFAFRSRYLFMITGSIGSLVLGILLFGFSFLLVGSWLAIVLPSILLGRLVISGMPSTKGFLISGIIAAVIALGLFYAEKNIIYQAMDNLSESVVVMLGGTDSSGSTTATLIDEFTKMLAVIKRLIPSLMALSAVTQIFIGWVALSVFLNTIGEYFPSFGSFVYWKMPYYFIYALGAMIFVRLTGADDFRIVADNVLLFMGFFYAVFGFSVFEYYLKKIRLSLFMRILFYIGFIFLQLPGLVLAAAVGLFDSYFDFRKVKARIIG